MIQLCILNFVLKVLVSSNFSPEQVSKWDFNFGGQLAINSNNLVAKVKKKW